MSTTRRMGVSMLLAAMRVRLPLLLLALILVVAASGCGEAGIEVAKSSKLHKGAEIFNQRCGGCHSLDAAGTEGSASSPKSMERKDGPNFNQRKEQYPDIIYAIQNGGFSSGPMPQNIITGNEAKVVACFVSKYSGKDAKQAPSPSNSTETTTKSSTDCEKSLPSR